MAAWQEFEAFIKKIQKETAPNAIVQHNNIVIGKSGRKRQLDVTITQNVGLYPVFIVIECKKYNRKVTIDKVEAFVTKCEDVKANVRVMISNAGFDAGAIAQAKSHNVILLSSRAAKQADWNNVLGEKAWIALYRNVPIELKAQFVCVRQLGNNSFASTEDIIVPEANHLLIDKNKFPTGVVSELIKKLYVQISDALPIGLFEVDAKPNDVVLLVKESVTFKVKSVRLKGIFTVREYKVNLLLASGNILNDVIMNQEKYNELISNSININDLMNSFPGREISLEEFLQMKNDPNGFRKVNISEDTKLIRLVVTKHD